MPIIIDKCDRLIRRDVAKKPQTAKVELSSSSSDDSIDDNPPADTNNPPADTNNNATQTQYEDDGMPKAYLSNLGGQLINEVKLYRVPKRSADSRKYAGDTKPILIGKNFPIIESSNETSSQSKQIAAESTTSSGDAKKVTRMPRYRGDSALRDISKGVLMKRIAFSSMRAALTKSGRSIKDDFETRTLEETISWAIQQASGDEVDLSRQLFSIEEEIKKFFEEKARMSVLLSPAAAAAAATGSPSSVKSHPPRKHDLKKGSPRHSTSNPLKAPFSASRMASGHTSKAHSRRTTTFASGAGNDPIPSGKSQPAVPAYGDKPLPTITLAATAVAEDVVSYANEEKVLLTDDHKIALQEVEDKFKVRLRSVTSLFRQEVHTVARIEKQFKAAANKVEVSCADVAKHCSNFQQLKEKQRRQILTICDDREFLRPQLMQAKIDKFDLDVFADGSGHSTVTTVSHGWDYIEESTMREIKNQGMDNLAKAKWFLAYINELQDYVHRTKFEVPLGCLRFLMTIKQLLMRGCDFTVTIFYHILEQTIAEKRDHRNIVVHKSVKAVRDFIQISAAEFLVYLRSNGIEPCAELVKQAEKVHHRKTQKNSSHGATRATATTDDSRKPKPGVLFASEEENSNSVYELDSGSSTSYYTTSRGDVEGDASVSFSVNHTGDDDHNHGNDPVPVEILQQAGMPETSATATKNIILATAGLEGPSQQDPSNLTTDNSSSSSNTTPPVAVAGAVFIPTAPTQPKSSRYATFSRGASASLLATETATVEK